MNNDDDLFSIQEADDLLTKGKQAWDRKEYQAAYDAWSQALAADPSKKKKLAKPLRAVKGKLYTRLVREAEELEGEGEKEEAIMTYQKALRMAPDEGTKEEVMERLQAFESQGQMVQYFKLGGAALGGILLLGLMTWLVLKFL